MSEYINNSEARLNALYEFAAKLIEGGNGKMLVDKYRDSIDNVNAEDTMQVLDLLINAYPFEKVKDFTGKIINVFHKSLESKEWEKPGEGHLLHYLMLENRELEALVEGIRPVIKSVLSGKEAIHGDNLAKLQAFVNSLKEYELHYIKKENVLFPFIEKTFTRHGCLKLMWSFHDDFRRGYKYLGKLLQDSEPDLREFNVELGDLFFTVLPVIFREEKIVFPVAFKYIQEDLWDEMLEQCSGLGWCYGVTPLYMGNGNTRMSIPGLTDLGTGHLTAEQIILMLNHLPVDITFVDENDEVLYFSEASHRIFPRSEAIIGRKVQNCHPHESVHVVNEIINEFRKGSKDHADFWINAKGRFIHIRYFALRDKQGSYRGTIEVSQDATEIRALEGQQRLLDWNVNS